jgi:fructoselysine-6-P-deglycase FrlB-like protein
MAEASEIVSDVQQPPHEVLLVSAGASHSVALLCKYYHFSEGTNLIVNGANLRAFRQNS